MSWLKKCSHQIVTVDGMKHKLAFQKGDRELYYFSGVYRFCRRKNCGWSEYQGPITPYAKEMIEDGLQMGHTNLAHQQA